MLGVAANAQTDNTPQKGDKTFGVSLGYSDYIHISALNNPEQNIYQIQALNNEWNQKSLGLDFEFGYFTGDTWKLMFGAGLSVVGNPGNPGVLGTGQVLDGDMYATGYPTYRAVASQTTLNYHLSVGFAKYLQSGVTNLMPYWGVRGSYAYAYNAQTSDDVQSLGKSKAESHNFRLAGHVGVDYFVAKGMYVGAQIDPVAYTLNTTFHRPVEGLERMKGSSNNISLLAQPTLKVGFKF